MAGEAVDSLQHEVRVISPAEAESLLTNVRNTAPLDRRQIGTYARDMAHGAWKLNGDPIIIDRAGAVLSGRLRLHACQEARNGFPTLLVRGVDPAHFDTIDALRRRTVSDVMAIRKERDGRALAAALAVLWRFANDDFTSQSKRVSAPALLAILEENPDLRLSLTTAKVAVPRIPHGLGAGLHYLLSRADPEKADAFFAAVGGDDVPTNGAVASLRRQLDEGIASGGRRNQVQLAGLILRAWEAYLLNRAVTFVRFSVDHDQFPAVAGLSNTVSFDGVRHSAERVQGNESDSELPRLSVRAETITPQRARAILERNDANRGIAGAVVEKYARDMRNGTWALNGQTIKIGSTGRLLDGQHRCAAALKANVAFPAMVVEGLDESVFDTFDVGTRRTISTLLRDRGEANTASLAAALRQLWLLETGLITLRTAAPTVSELVDVLERNPGLRDSVKLAHKVRDVSSSIALALHYLFAKTSREKANDFMDRLADGVMLDFDNPVRRLREALLADKANKKIRLSDSEKAALMIKAWNSYLVGRPLRTLKWQNSGEKREAFPNISGVQVRGLAA